MTIFRIRGDNASGFLNYALTLSFKRGENCQKNFLRYTAFNKKMLAKMTNMILSFSVIKRSERGTSRHSRNTNKISKANFGSR